MGSSACATPWVRRCLVARPPSAGASPTLSTRKLSSSRSPSSSCRTSPCWSPSTTGAAWSARRWWAGSPWARAAAGRRSRATGRRWRTRRGRRSAGGTRCWSPRGGQGSLQVLGQRAVLILCQQKAALAGHTALSCPLHVMGIKGGKDWEASSCLSCLPCIFHILITLVRSSGNTCKTLSLVIVLLTFP